MKKQSGILAIIYTKEPLRFLVVYNNRTKNTTFPAGTEEENEPILETLKREVKEETGLNPLDYTIEETELTYKFSSKKKSGLQKAYLLQTSILDSKPTDKHLEVKGWFSYEEAMDILTFKGHKNILKRVLKLISP